MAEQRTIACPCCRREISPTDRSHVCLGLAEVKTRLETAVQQLPLLQAAIEASERGEQPSLEATVRLYGLLRGFRQRLNTLASMLFTPEELAQAHLVYLAGDLVIAPEESGGGDA